MKSKILTAFLIAGATVLGIPTQAATLVNQWKFEGNANDTSGSGNNGAVAGSPTYTAGIFGQALYLNPLDLVQKTNATGLPLLGADSWSCNAWFFLTNTPQSLAYFAGFGTPLSTGAAGSARALLAFGNPGAVGIYSWGSSRDLASGLAYPLNQWIMVTITHDGATGRRTIWLNGTNIASGVQALVTAPATISVGATPFAGRFQGLIDEFTIWQGSVTTNDVASLFASNNIPLIPTAAIAPQSVTVYAGEYASFTVLAGGVGPQTLQWLKGDVGIPGATNVTYAINSVTAGDATNYSVVVSNLNGSVTSSPPATLTVLPVPNIATALGGYWQFDETTGLAAADSTGAGNDGTLFNFAGDDSQWVPGKVGGSLKFRGPGAGLKDYVQVANHNINPPTTMTVSAWVWADALTTWGTIVKNWPNAGANPQIHLGTDGAAGDLSNYLGGPAGGQIGPVREGVGTLLPVAQWIHVALVCNGQTMQMYRNGAPVGTPLAYSGRLNVNTLTNTLGIGVKLLATGLPEADTGAPGYWKGRMDDLGIWTRGLTRTEILSIFLAGQAGQPLTNAGSFSAALPLITSQPQGVRKYAGEYKAQFVVLAAGSGALTYQWRAEGTNVAGATNNVLNLTGPFTNSANYAVVVTDAGNGLSLTSAPAALTVQAVTSITNGLAGYWKFDETSGMTAADSTVNARVASLNNYPDNSMWVTGRIGGALTFGGDLSGQYASVENFVQATNHTLTLSAWVWADTAPNLASILDNFGQTSIGQLRLGLGSAVTRPLTGSILAQGGGAIAATEATGFPTGSWQHVALVADGAILRLYRNGSQVISSAYNGTIVSPSPIMNLFIGARIGDDGVNFNTTPGFWTGKMDDLGIWTRGLTVDEIQAVFAAGYGGRPLTSAVAGTVVKPIVTTPPVSQTVTEGADATFTAAAIGTDPLNYQWRKNGTNILAATNATFTLHSTLLSDAADYAVVVGNIVGSVTSAPPATLTVNAVSRPLPAMTNQLVDYWKLDETSGTNALDSISANNGVLQNYLGDDSQWVRGVVGGALQFGGPGTSNAVYVPDYPKPDTTMTVAAWVFAEARPTWASILKNWGGAIGQFHFGLNNTVGNLSIFIQQANGAVVSAFESVVFPTNSWQHVAFTCDGTNVWVYRNGIQVASVLYDGTLQSSPAMTCLGIGAKLTTDCGGMPEVGNPGFWQGRMDDLGLWTRSLLALEVQSLYISGLSGRGIDSALLSPPLRLDLAGGNLIFSWPEVAQGRGFVLESTTVLPAGSWTPVGVPVTVVDSRCFVAVPATSAGNKFYRLRH